MKQVIRGLRVCAGILFGLGMMACTGTEQGPRFLSVGTAPPGGAFFVVGGAIAEVVDANNGDSWWQVSSEATKGTQENIRRLAKDEIVFVPVLANRRSD